MTEEKYAEIIEQAKNGLSGDEIEALINAAEDDDIISDCLKMVSDWEINSTMKSFIFYCDCEYLGRLKSILSNNYHVFAQYITYMQFTNAEITITRK
jgi:hypothetical protein